MGIRTFIKWTIGTNALKPSVNSIKKEEKFRVIENAKIEAENEKLGEELKRGLRFRFALIDESKKVN